MKYQSKMAILAFTVALATNLAACSKGGSGSNNDSGKTPSGQPAGAKFVTDTSQCGSGSSAGSINGTWESDMVVSAGDSEELAIQGRFTFSNGNVTVTNVCSIAGRTVQVAAHSTYVTNGNSIRFLSEDNEHREINEPNFHLNCDISLKPMTINYSVNGSCLVFSKPGESDTFTLIPVGATSGTSPSQPTWPNQSPPSTQPTWPPQQPPIHQLPPQQPPVAQPTPPQGDFPPPYNPQPGQPAPAPAGQYACMTDNRTTNQVYIGYGGSQFAAAALAKKACSGATDNYYCNEPKMCGQLEMSQDAWFCEVDNRTTNLVYTATGRSQGEATYLARKSCVTADSSKSYYCNKDEKVACVHQH